MICQPTSIRGHYGRGFLLNIKGTLDEHKHLAKEVQALNHTIGITSEMPDRPFVTSVEALELVRTYWV